MLGALEAEGSGYLLNRQICFGKQHFGYFVFFFVIKRQKINITRFRVIGGAVDLKSPRALCHEFKHGHTGFLASLIISGIAARKADKLAAEGRKTVRPSEIILICPHEHSPHCVYTLIAFANCTTVKISFKTSFLKVFNF